MSKLNTIGVCLAATLLLPSCGNKKVEANEQRAFETMVIEYQSKTSMAGVEMVEHETMWIDQGNNKEATLTKQESKIMGQTSTEETLNITDGNWSYTINMQDKTGTKTNIKELKEMAQVFAKLMKVDAKSLKELVEKNGGKMLGEETFLGKTCTVIELMGTKQWLYKGVPLKIEMNKVNYVKEAVKVEENVKIPADRFKIPQGVAITEAPALPDMQGEGES